MARYLGPKLKLARREGVDLFLKSAERSLDSKSRFPLKPGAHGKQMQSKVSDYGLQLREKQKVKRTYGMLEKQFRRFFSIAEKLDGNLGVNFLHTLEKRLDNVVYRAGFARTRAEARQMVSHGMFEVNATSLSIPSALIEIGDVVSLKPKDGTKQRVSAALEMAERSGRQIASWLDVSKDVYSIKFLSLPDRDDFAQDIREDLVVQMFSR